MPIFDKMIDRIYRREEDDIVHWTHCDFFILLSRLRTVYKEKAEHPLRAERALFQRAESPVRCD